MGDEILTPTWQTWEEFDTEYDAYKKRLDASGVASVGVFFFRR